MNYTFLKFTHNKEPWSYKLTKMTESQILHFSPDNFNKTFNLKKLVIKCYYDRNSRISTRLIFLIKTSTIASVY